MDRFNPLLSLSSSSLFAWQELWVSYLNARGVNDPAAMEQLCREDLLHIAQALSLLFEEDPTRTLAHFLGEHSHLMEGHRAEIEHVGRELFGPISFYLKLLGQIAEQLDLGYLSDLVFPSTEVVKLLQKQDSGLKDITIGRVYFKNLIKSPKIASLELFQASSKDGKNPQHFNATQIRLSALCNSFHALDIIPIDHIAVRIDTIDDVQKIHDRISWMRSETAIPALQEVSYNFGDRSAHTKILLRDAEDRPFNRIVEFINYRNP